MPEPLPLPLFPAATEISLDIETTGLDWRDTVTAIAVSDSKRAHVLDVRGHHPADVAAWLTAQVYTRPVVVHNAAFDLVFLRRQYGVGYPEQTWDTYLAEWLLTAGLDEEEADENDDSEAKAVPLSRSLQAAAARRLGKAISKDAEIRTGFTLDATFTPAMIEYAAEDALTTAQLAAAQRLLIRREQMSRIAAIEMACVPVFCEMVFRGVQVDLPGLRAILAETQVKADRLRAHLETTLTPHRAWFLMGRQRADEARLTEWLARLSAAEAAAAAAWPDLCRDPDRLLRDFVDNPQAYQIDGLKPVTEQDVQGWLDQKVHKASGQPEGLRRYTRWETRRWRHEPGNERPAIRLFDIAEPVNIRSYLQRTIALQGYLDTLEKATGVAVPMPDNFRSKTLRAYAVDVPEVVRTEVIEPLQQFSKADKLLTSFGEALASRLDEQHALHGGWRQIGTGTGRPSCASPNLLNMPNNAAFRSRFVARDGCLFVVADFSQIELRLLAEASGDEALVSGFVEGRDVHLDTAIDQYGKPADQITDNERKTAKIVNFGICYGMGPKSLRWNLGGWGVFETLDNCRQYITTWRKTRPRAAGYLRRMGDFAVEHGYAATPLGRRRYFAVAPGMPVDQKAAVQRRGANHCIQGANADITKLSMALMAPEITALGGAILLQVYDEIVVEVPAAAASVASEVVVAAMRDAAQAVLRKVPVVVDAVISPTWSEKDAIKEVV
ncbi:MAG: hypothetical protein IT340_20115 [Chloroflexi bacterium]|nr:hypothetical protein [Chloroflexota bacterium]